MFVIFFLGTLTGACLFESEIVANFSTLTLLIAQQGCDSVSPCNSIGVHPLVSFIGTEIDDQLALIACDRRPLSICEHPQYIIGETFHHALFVPLTRKLEVLGLSYAEGYWTFANRHGEIIPRAYSDPHLDQFMLGEERTTLDSSVQKKWLCVCLT